MMKNLRYSCWLINNIKFSGEDFTVSLTFEEQQIEILITNYQNSNMLSPFFKDWIQSKIVNNGMRMMNSPLPDKSIFVLTKNGHENSSANEFSQLFRRCLQLAYIQPTLVSHVSENIPNAILTLPTWEGFKSLTPISKNEINKESFKRVIKYFNELKVIPRNNLYVLDEIYKICGIGDVLIELLSLYSFIEGFWHNQIGSSNLATSFNLMLSTDYAPGNENKTIRKGIKSTFEKQNGLLRNSKIDDLRHILTHGIYKNLENSWNSEQWKAVYEQRDLLFQIVIESLINRIRHNAA